jgi:ketosteroid isomerase-like protein
MQLAARGLRAEVTPLDINIPDVHAEISAAFHRYVSALIANDIDAVIASFWDSEHTLRYGTGENLYGMDAIKKFRNSQRGQPIQLEIARLVITSFGRDYGTANCEMWRKDLGVSARMSHAWVRLAQGWRIVAAHVSMDPSPK